VRLCGGGGFFPLSPNILERVVLFMQSENMSSSTPAGATSDPSSFLVSTHRRLAEEMGKVIVGQTEVIEQLLIAVLAGGHCLLEGAPGLAKTAMVRSLAEAMHLTFRRIQFTPDLMPADITGTDIIQEDPATGARRFVFQKGPIFSQMLLADEINRTPPKTQAALLEAMQEHAVTAAGKTYTLDEPFFVLATQNPIEQEGTYPLPEAQKDRFLFHIRVGYPDRAQEREIVARTTGTRSGKIEQVISGDQILECQRLVREVPVPDHVLDFVVDLVRMTRPGEADAPAFVKEQVEWGAGPRASQCLVLAGKVRALLKGRAHVRIEDIEALAAPVLRHRLAPTFHAESQGVGSDDIVARVLKEVPRPGGGSLL
jgi:MoxR-like ATPase